MEGFAGPENIMTDLEQASVAAFRKFYPGVTQSGCFFHFCQALYAKMKVNYVLLNRWPTDEDLEPGLKGELEMLFGMVKSMPKPEAVSTEMFLYQEVLELRSTFYNIEVALRIYLSLIITNASGERSFSKMKLIKNRLRTTMLYERLNNLALMSSESDILRELDFDEIKKDFFEQNRKTPASSVFM
ncbi:hypothetical protein DMENIID0001_037860 [Sergentomyia squamirostris]